MAEAAALTTVRQVADRLRMCLAKDRASFQIEQQRLEEKMAELVCE